MVISDKRIYRYDGVIDPTVCDDLLKYYNNTITVGEYDVDKLPWFENDIIYLSSINDIDIFNKIQTCKSIISELVGRSYETEIYPHLTTLVMWREGRSMTLHKDDGYENDKDALCMRKFSAVVYLNDDYTGGETIILKENLPDVEYVSKPKKGSVVIFKSDGSCIHGVNPVTNGARLTMAMWFSDDVRYEEMIKKR